MCVSNQAVCTSGDYERVVAAPEHHILNPRSGTSPSAVASATVVAPSAMLADALATAAFVLGPVEGIRLLERHGCKPNRNPHTACIRDARATGAAEGRLSATGERPAPTSSPRVSVILRGSV
jgi:hypothetical protein